MPEIGATLREARMRARIDVSEIEAQTKIRAKYLRALENEEWNLLPGPTFVKSFLRTYAQALGLDGKLLVEEYRLSHERPSESERPELGQQPIGAGSRRPRQRGPQPRATPSRGYAIAVGVIGLVIVLLIVGLLSRGKGKQPSHPAATTGSTTGTAGKAHTSTGAAAKTGAASSSQLVSLQLQPTAQVYVCLRGADGRKIIPGSILQPGATLPTYRSKRFSLTLGNNSVRLLLNGTPRSIPASSKPIGYSITRAGRRVLPAGQLPTCK
ncbi:MAG TPA: helix-turn-helix domain-containing protein [Solirubrobacteraceae bacterium]|nr:helix-turn-helix domain-containing protein [Solirubrobacteraceae bacterium]